MPIVVMLVHDRAAWKSVQRLDRAWPCDSVHWIHEGAVDIRLVEHIFWVRGFILRL